MKCVIALALKIPELKKIISIGRSVAEKFYVEVARNQYLWQQLSFYFHRFVLSPVANMAANYICIKQKSKVL